MELKNDLAITGTLHSVDQYLNIKLNAIRVRGGSVGAGGLRGARAMLDGRRGLGSRV